MARPVLSRIPEWFHGYVNRVSEDDLITALDNQSRSFPSFLKQIPESMQDHRYAPGKWTIRQMVLHIIDAERIFGYRALCIARKETVSLPGFNEDDYADHSKPENRDWQDLCSEFDAVRNANMYLFRSFDAEQLEASGIASNKPVYVLGIGYIMVGHVAHHEAVLKERYLT